MNRVPAKEVKTSVVSTQFKDNVEWRNYEGRGGRRREKM